MFARQKTPFETIVFTHSYVTRKPTRFLNYPNESESIQSSDELLGSCHCSSELLPQTPKPKELVKLMPRKSNPKELVKTASLFIVSYTNNRFILQEEKVPLAM